MGIWRSGPLALVFLVTVLSSACGPRRPPPRVVEQLDVERYMGTWHEIARLPFGPEENCLGSSAYYELVNDEEFHITNYCWYLSFFGPMRKAEADAMIPDPEVPAKIKVRFFWPIVADYWVLYVSDDYRRAVVGTPNRKYLWILSRDFAVDEAAYTELVEVARNEGYDVSQLIVTPQQNNPERQTVQGEPQP